MDPITALEACYYLKAEEPKLSHLVSCCALLLFCQSIFCVFLTLSLDSPQLAPMLILTALKDKTCTDRLTLPLDHECLLSITLLELPLDLALYDLTITQKEQILNFPGVPHDKQRALWVNNYPSPSAYARTYVLTFA